MTTICDFCSSPDVVKGYDVPDFTLPEYGFGSTGGFAACEECARLVDEKRKFELRKRAITTFFKKYGDIMPLDIVDDFVTKLHWEFWKRWEEKCI